MRELAAERARHVANSLKIELIEVETNLREFGQPHVSWPKAYFGSGLAAVGLLLAPRFERIYLSSGYSTAEHPPSGSHPDLDPLWTDGTTQIVYEGQDVGRFDKLQLIHEWPLIQENLRVCYQNTAPHLNCGRCVKCTWTQMILRALGSEQYFTTFEQPLSLKRLGRFPPSDRHVAQRFQRCLEILRESGDDIEFIRALEEGLDKQGSPPFLARATQFKYKVGNYLAHRIPGGGP